MDGDVELLKRIYDRFNARDIDRVLAVLVDDVTWANDMDGGHVHGREAVREYWTRQWTLVSPHVQPVSFYRIGDGAIIAEVRQSVRWARWLASTSRMVPTACTHKSHA
jgi:nuclear transport factor 2 (NTF2) superfamily protein